MFTFGADPELMLFYDDDPRSAIGIVPGTCYNRHDLGHHKVFYDGVLAECEIKPGKNKEEVLHNFRDCFVQLQNLLRPLEIRAQVCAQYPADQLRHPEAREAGCKKEICAYANSDKKPPNSFYRKNNFRVAGGHIHLGHWMLKENKDPEVDWKLHHINRMPLVRLLDLFVGSPCVWLDDPQRKKLYGKAGRFRDPSHGLEYRTLGNFWLASPVFVELIYDLCSFTMDFMESRKLFKYWSYNEANIGKPNAWKCTGYSVGAVRNSIDSGDKSIAFPLVSIFGENWPKNLLKRWQEATCYKPKKFAKEWS